MQISRRGAISGIGLVALAAPAIIQSPGLLMRICAVIWPDPVLILAKTTMVLPFGIDIGGIGIGDDWNWEGYCNGEAVLSKTWLGVPGQTPKLPKQFAKHCKTIYQTASQSVGYSQLVPTA
jgi:hypothetical protein